MSINSETKLKFRFEEITTTTAVGRFRTAYTPVYSLLIGINEDSASASTGVWVSDVGTVDQTNKEGVLVTSTTPFPVSPMSIGRNTIPLDLSDYYIGCATGDTLWCAFLEETPITV